MRADDLSRVADGAAKRRCMATPPAALPVRRSFGQTMRKDAWWIQPLVVFTVFTGSIIYSTWAAFQGTFYWHENLLSRFIHRRSGALLNTRLWNVPGQRAGGRVFFPIHLRS